MRCEACEIHVKVEFFPRTRENISRPAQIIFGKEVIGVVIRFKDAVVQELEIVA